MAIFLDSVGCLASHGRPASKEKILRIVIGQLFFGDSTQSEKRFEIKQPLKVRPKYRLRKFGKMQVQNKIIF